MRKIFLLMTLAYLFSVGIPSVFALECDPNADSSMYYERNTRWQLKKHISSDQQSCKVVLYSYGMACYYLDGKSQGRLKRYATGMGGTLATKKELWSGKVEDCDQAYNDFSEKGRIKVVQILPLLVKFPEAPVAPPAPKKEFTLSGTITDSHNRPLKNIIISFWWNDEGSKNWQDYKEVVYTNENKKFTNDKGEYKLTFKKPAEDKLKNGKGYLRVDLKDENKIFTLIDWNRGMDSGNDKKITEQRLKERYASWYFFGQEGITSFITLSEKENQLELNPDFNTKKTVIPFFQENNAQNNAHIYVNIKIAADFYKNLGVDFHLPLKVFTFVDEDASYFKTKRLLDFITGTAFQISKYETSRVTGPLMALTKENSDLVSSNHFYTYRQNAEWHEFTHYVDYLVNPKQLSGACQDPLKFVFNHDGYFNPCTKDAIAEGLAEFMGQIIYDEYYKKPKDDDYKYPNGAVLFSLDENVFIDTPSGRRFDRDAEEMAVAGLLWDLYDDVNFADEDNFQLDIKTIWQLLMEKTNFPWIHEPPEQAFGKAKENRPVTYIADLYVKFKDFFASDAAKQNAWDHRIIDSRIWFDRSPARQAKFPYSYFDKDDVIGIPNPSGFPMPSDFPRHDRNSFTPSTSSIAVLKSPKEVLPYEAIIKINVESPHDYLSTTYTIPIDQEEQSVYIYLPSNYKYKSTYTVTAKKDTYPEKEIFKLSSDEYWATSEPFEVKHPSLIPSPPSPPPTEKQVGKLWIYILISLLVIGGMGAIIYLLFIKKNPPSSSSNI